MDFGSIVGGGRWSFGFVGGVKNKGLWEGGGVRSSGLDGGVGGWGMGCVVG